MINAKTTNWCVVPWACRSWARVVHPGLDAAEAMRAARGAARLRAATRRAGRGRRVAGADRRAARVGTRLDAAAFDALHFEGPGTDLTVGLLPTSHFAKDSPGTTTVDGINHNPNLPTEEIFTVARSDARRRRRHGDEAARRERHARDAASACVSRRPGRLDRGRRRAPRRCGRAARRTKTRRGSARSRSSTGRAGSARRTPSSSTRCSTRTPPAISRSGTPTSRRSARRTTTGSTRARSTSTS